MGDAMLRREPLFFESRTDFRDRYEAAEKHVSGEEPFRELAYACLPLVVHGQTLAGVALIFSGARPFDQEERKLLTVLAHHIAQALERANLFEREKKTREQLTSLQQLVTVLSSAATAEAVAMLATRVGAEALGLVGAGLWAIDDHGDLSLLGDYGMSDEHRAAFRRIPIDSALPAARIARERRPLWCESEKDVEAEPPTVEAALGRGDAFQAYGALPLLRDDRVLGVLAFTAGRPRRFPPEERRFMSSIAEHCAGAIARARLYDDARRMEQRLQSVLERMPIGVLVSRPPHGTLVFANDAYARIWRLDAVPLRSEERCELMKASYVDGRPIPMAESPTVRALGGEVAEPIDARIERGDASVGWVRISAAPVLRDDGTVEFAVATAIDVSTEKEARAAADEAGRAKDEFLATLSHELRNPLSPIRNGLDVIERVPPGTEASTKAMAIIRRQVYHLTRIVDDLLDVTRISRGKISLKKERLDLRGLVRSTIDDHRARFEALGVTLVGEPSTEALWVDADPTRIVQVVGNLLVNASKFTPRGGRVEVTMLRDHDTALVTVRDDGVGIASEMLNRLFEPFVQAPQTLDRTGGGLGLGLAMAAGLVNLHGGSIRAESDGLGRGSEFLVRLPLVPGPTGATLPLEKVALTPRHVLVIEDNEDSAEMMRLLLTLDGHEVSIASDGSTGIELARSIHPSVVFCDIGLPDMDGYAVARALRADAPLRHTILCALSGYAQPDDRARSATAGFDRHLAKPPSHEDLREVLNTARAGARGG
jgi:signal transduction histidine kinase/ActR/RegA family two-component response regulator